MTTFIQPLGLVIKKLLRLVALRLRPQWLALRLHPQWLALRLHPQWLALWLRPQWLALWLRPQWLALAVRLRRLASTAPPSQSATVRRRRLASLDQRPGRFARGAHLLGAALFVLSLASTASVHADDAPTFADRTDDEVGVSERTLALVLNPLATAQGVFGCEADFALLPRMALSLEGDIYDLGSQPGTTFAAGILLYPLSSAFHGLYFAPRVVLARPLRDSPVHIDWNRDVLGMGATAGWSWTWDYGLTLRIGGGAMFLFGGPTDGHDGVSGTELAFGSADVVLDTSVGWAF